MSRAGPGIDLATQELSERNWKDFERLFRKSGEWSACWCMYYHRPRPLKAWDGRSGLTQAQRIKANRRDKRRLVRDGCSHGVLVYADGEPVGWCQYGPKDELPRIDAGRKYKNLVLKDEGKNLWRITCFAVDRRYRRRGVATTALKAALRSIADEGGGVVEAYPATRAGALALWFGTVSMFEREGFRNVAPFGKSNVLMRKYL